MMRKRENIQHPSLSLSLRLSSTSAGIFTISASGVCINWYYSSPVCFHEKKVCLQTDYVVLGTLLEHGLLEYDTRELVPSLKIQSFALNLDNLINPARRNYLLIQSNIEHNEHNEAVSVFFRFEAKLRRLRWRILNEKIAEGNLSILHFSQGRESVLFGLLSRRLNFPHLKEEASLIQPHGFG
jgi:hypothetical protein